MLLKPFLITIHDAAAVGMIVVEAMSVTAGGAARPPSQVALPGAAAVGAGIQVKHGRSPLKTSDALRIEPVASRNDPAVCGQQVLDLQGMKLPAVYEYTCIPSGSMGL